MTDTELRKEGDTPTEEVKKWRKEMKKYKVSLTFKITKGY